jgi:hypothetical protein
MVGLLEALMLAHVPGMVRLQLRAPLAVVLALGLALADWTSLRRAGIRGPAPWWALLGPVYLFLRPRTVGPSAAMGLAWCGSFVAWLVVPTVLAVAAGVHINTDRISNRMQSDLEQQTGREVTVTCPPPMMLRIGDSFDCALHSGPYYATATVTIFNSNGGYRVQSRAVPAPTR